MDLKVLSDRRLANLDSAISYFQKRILSFRRKRGKVLEEVNSAEYSLTEAESLAFIIIELEDVVAYLKLC